MSDSADIVPVHRIRAKINTGNEELSSLFDFDQSSGILLEHDLCKESSETTGLLQERGQPFQQIGHKPAKITLIQANIMNYWSSKI
jgi:hypothetical protein